MQSLVVFDSQFGNTEQIARTVALALGGPARAGVLGVNELTPGGLRGVRLLVVGSPTQRFRPTPALTHLLDNLPRTQLAGMQVAAFDTRLAMTGATPALLKLFVRLAGPRAFAAPHLAGILQRHGGTLVTAPEGFVVQDTQGPLAAGELERAARWGRALRRGA